MLITTIAVVLVLGGLIFFHELGHFSVARAFKMGVSTFSLGFGPKLLKKRVGKTEYALSLVPLGGYVALVGETEGAEIPEGFSREEIFSLRPAWQRLLVVLAGPIANILMAWAICWALAFCWGTPVLQADVAAVMKDSPAERAGLKVGDHIVSIDGRAIESWEEMSETIARSDGRPMELEVVRPAAEGTSGQAETLRVTLAAERSTRKTIFGEEETAWLIGVRGGGRVLKKPETFFRAAVAGLAQTRDMISLTWQSFVKLAQRVVPLDQVGGPIMIAQLVGEQAHQSLPGLLMLTALISINLGILNLLPVPVLDGGTAVFCIIEILARRPVPMKMQEWGMRVGIFLLIALMVLATFNDVWRLVKS